MTENDEWSKQYIVFSVSRLDLEHQLGFTHRQIGQLSDAEMQVIVEKIREAYSYLEDDFSETVYDVTSTVLSEKTDTDNRTAERRT